MKQVKLQSYRRKYEMMQMEEDRKVSDYFSKLTAIVNQMRTCGENIIDQMVAEKVLRSLSTKFDFIVVFYLRSKGCENYENRRIVKFTRSTSAPGV